MDKFLNTGFWERTLDQGLHWLVTSGPRILIILVMAYLGLRAVRILLNRLKQTLTKRAIQDHEKPGEVEKRIETLSGILRNAIKLVIWIVVSMLILRELGVDIAPIIAGAGIIGLAVGFGAQNLVRDVISGFFMLVENQVRVGDVAILNGTGGLVEKVQLRTTVLRDLSGVVHVFPNGTISSLSNMTKDWSAMVFNIGVAYNEDVDQVMEVMKEVSEELRKDEQYANLIKEPMEVFGLDSFGDNAVIIKGRIKTKPIQQWAVGREYNRRLKKVFDEKGISIPFPQRTLHWNSGDEALAALLQPKNNLKNV